MYSITYILQINKLRVRIYSHKFTQLAIDVYFSHTRAKVSTQIFLVPKSMTFFFHQGVVDFLEFREILKRIHIHGLSRWHY